MINKNWNEIVTAWAKWVNGEGLGVQGKRESFEGWDDWIMQDVLDKNMYTQWRIKTPKTFARLLKSQYGINHATKLEGEPDPEIADWCKFSQWIGPWQEVPQEDDE